MKSLLVQRPCLVKTYTTGAQTVLQMKAPENVAAGAQRKRRTVAAPEKLGPAADDVEYYFENGMYILLCKRGSGYTMVLSNKGLYTTDDRLEKGPGVHMFVRYGGQGSLVRPDHCRCSRL